MNSNVILVEKEVKEIIKNITNWFKYNNGKKAIIGISGGKDSTVCAALCVKALGKENVIGVLMPNGVQPDFDDSIRVCKFLDIEWIGINIEKSYNSIITQIPNPSDDTEINLPARLRMSSLYAVAQSYEGGRVINTCNLSEDIVGYSTIYGDMAGSYAPIRYYTVTEVKKIGKFLNLPIDLIEKTPSDGLCGQSDEEKLGILYKDIDAWIRQKWDGYNETDIKKITKIVEEKYNNNVFKLHLINIPGSVPRFLTIPKLPRFYINYYCIYND